MTTTRAVVDALRRRLTDEEIVLSDGYRRETEAVLAHIDAVEAERDRYRQRMQTLVDDVDALISDSDGVAGLHRNGDLAPWSELTAGGRFETWLGSLEEARQALEEAQSDD
jgi:hypothetical protein